MIKRAILLIALTPAAAPAASTDVAQIARLDACRTIAANDARLACFDREAAALDAAIARKDVAVIDRQEVRRTRRSLFGFSLPNFGIFAASEKEAKSPEFTQLDGTIKKVTKVSYQRYDMEIEDGAVWRNSDLLDYPPDVGDKFHISKTPFGAFLMRVAGGRSVHASRVH